MYVRYAMLIYVIMVSRSPKGSFEESVAYFAESPYVYAVALRSMQALLLHIASEEASRWVRHQPLQGSLSLAANPSSRGLLMASLHAVLRCPAVILS